MGSKSLNILGSQLVQNICRNASVCVFQAVLLQGCYER